MNDGISQGAADAAEEARKALEAVGEVGERARKVVRYKGVDAIYMIWGAVWIVAFMLQQFLPMRMLQFGTAQIPTTAFIWWPLILAGVVGTFVVVRRRTPVKAKGGARIGIFWGVLWAYVYVFMYVLWPAVNREVLFGAEGVRMMAAVFSLVPMFAYVVMGLWLNEIHLVCLGLGVTAATVVGYAFVTDFFYLWMAVFGGGALFAAGVLARGKWTKT